MTLSMSKNFLKILTTLPLTPCNESYETEEISSKDTLSVGGSEEVRALKYDDGGMKSGLSGLRELRTRCYDVKVDIVSQVKGSNVIEAAELYGPSSLSEVEMDKFLGSARGLAIPKNRGRSQRLLRMLQVTEGLEIKKGSSSPKKVREPEVRGDKVVKFVPRPLLVELDPELRETGVITHGKGKALVPTPSFQSSIFENKTMLAAKRFINSYVPEVDRRRARKEALTHGGSSVVKHAFEKKNGEMQKQLDEGVPTVMSLQDERDSLKMILLFEERKRTMYEEKIEAQEKEIKKMKESKAELKKNVKLLVHNGMEEHIAKKKVKSQYPEVDLTKITFGEQEESVEEDGEMEEGEVEVGGIEVKESQPPLPMEVHQVPSEED
ncbi:hypothetical protein SLEP1_g29966 [Rubroshorea leprosula]|uniref:Uncharacterized protein n=1 Tax=Rubroshorea leprosula TaxID=152421 RepID=A0AAV5K6P1_9ROSI|nr:hypothetical protein SLEP1_g29966 [Rubroshorea leprosula]